MPQALVAIGAPIVGALAGKAIAGSGGRGQAAVPRDLQGLRSNQIQMLTKLLGGGNPMANIESMFGQSLTNPMQRQATNTLTQYASAQRPEMRTLEALTPLFDRNLAAANQSGGRFGSANALMRSRAAEDFNILGAGISQQAQRQQIEAANILGMFGQQDIANRLGMFNQLFAQANSATMGQPAVVTPSGAQQGAQLGGGIGDILMQLLSKGASGGGVGGAALGNMTQSMGR